jgi:AhpD family alkylhydroperoxidase
VTTYHDVLADLRKPTADLRQCARPAWEGFTALHQAAMAPGALPTKVKECMALAIAVADGCDGCIGYHARGAARAGATRAEVAEALSVALLMAGGPASVQAPRAWQAFLEFAPAEEDVLDADGG